MVEVLKSLPLNFIQILDQKKFDAIIKKTPKNQKNPGQFMQLDLTDALPNANHSRCLFPKTRLSFRDYEDP